MEVRTNKIMEVQLQMKKTIFHVCMLLFLAATLITLASAQLTNSTKTSMYECVNTQWYYNYNYSNWQYKDPSGVEHAFPGSTQVENRISYTCGDGAHTCYCGVNLDTSLDTLSSDGRYYLTAKGASGSVQSVTSQSGYINPRYVILGVTYAPPGSQSYVQYGDTTMIGTSTSLNGSFSDAAGISVSVSDTAGDSFQLVGGTLGVSDTTTDTYSTTFTDEQDSSSSVAISTTKTWTDKVPGSANSYLGVDHDYDVIWLWLNPLLNFTATEIGAQPTTITWTGYSYDADDINEMDVYPVYLGWLTGKLSTPGPNTTDLTPLERAWAANPAYGQIWASGMSPSLLNSSNTAINPADAAIIAAADPFSNSSYKVTVPAGSLTSSDGRFTLTGNQVVDYVQPPPGGQPITQQYTDSTTTTQTQGEGAKYTYQIGYSWENKFTATFLLDSWSSDIKLSDTLTWNDQWSKTNTEQNGVTATSSITGPPCAVSGSVCSPVYTGPTEFELFQDNIYNTFMYYPVN
jgi:hypothetical protein